MKAYLSLYNSAPKDTARDIIEYSCLSPGMVSRSLESLHQKSGLVEDIVTKRIADISICVCCPGAAPILEKLTQAQTKFITCIAGISKRILRRSAKLQRRWLKIWMRIKTQKSPSLKNKRECMRGNSLHSSYIIKQNQKQISWHLNIGRQRRFHNASVVQ